MTDSTQKKKIALPGRHKKRLFIAILALTTVLASVLLYGVWYIARLGLAEIASPLPMVVGVLFALFSGGALLAVLNMVLAVKGWFYLPFLQRQTYELINILFPVAVYVAKVFGIGKRQLEGSFIATSNLLFNRLGIKVPADRLLVVTPHCLQLATCPHKITRDPQNCKRCGGCDIGSLVTLSEKMGFHFFVATGGTLARQIVYNTRPKAVLAIACERDLMSGIQDVYPLPAVGVLNIRPNGPCYNTHVDMDEVRAQLEKIIIPKE
ncbi:DUF116 domain-containing protein [Selenomonas ruminantium]|uniref:DUF116 domain-containing protein n=1 Tax=Selenomonas ruminantium TaxID=971 RepID=UPI0026E9FA16|nr:DUF116 domain-containing protein [Selenomonas ruminantium]